MERWTAWFVLGVLILGVSACAEPAGAPGAEELSATDYASSEFPTCQQWTERAVSADEVALGCVLRGSNSIAVQGTAVRECHDGRSLYWNDYGWGYVGSLMTPHAVGAEKVAPAVERDSCEGGAPAAPSPSTTASELAALRAAVQAYSDAYLTGSQAAYDMLSARCRARHSSESFAAILAGAKALYGSPLAIRTFEAEIAGNLARATYTYEVAAINQTGEPWVREGGGWHEDDC